MERGSAEDRRLRLEDHPLLTDSILRTLVQNSVRSVLELLGAEAHRLAVLTGLSLPQVLDVREALLVRHGTNLQHGLGAEHTPLSTGINSLDSVLIGGVPIGEITEICGLAGSGKSQLCFTIVIRAIVASNCAVLYIDTKGDFSPVQIQKYLENNGYSHEKMAEIMDKIKVARIWTMPDLIHFINQVRNSVCDVENLQLIIIDSLPSLMFQFLGDDNKMSLTLLNKFVNTARYLCNERSISMICINILTRWVEQAPQDVEEKNVQTSKGAAWVEMKHRCLGRYWQHIPAVVIQLEKIPNDSTDDNIIIKATITKLSNGPSGVNCNLCLNDLGIN